LQITISRWLLLPWLIYIMIIVVGVALAGILLVVIPLGSPSGSQGSILQNSISAKKIWKHF
jgi:hypothetical protein